MDWYIVLALAVPFLFVVGVVYSAIKEQKVLEDGPLKKVLAERHAKGLINKRGAYDDEDDYGVPARQDLKRSKSEPQDNPSEAQRSQSESLSEQQGHQAESASSPAESASAPAETQRTQNDGATEPNHEPKRYESLGNIEARDAASYFAKYYK